MPEGLTDMEQAFDLNTGEVLEHWQVAFASVSASRNALAVFDRNQITVNIRSSHGDITTGMRAKNGFPDVITLHALVTPPADPHLAGTDICLRGVSDDVVAIAKGFFLRYSGDTPLKQTRLGDVLTRRATELECAMSGSWTVVARQGSMSTGWQRRYWMCLTANRTVKSRSSRPVTARSNFGVAETSLDAPRLYGTMESVHGLSAFGSSPLRRRRS